MNRIYLHSQRVDQNLHPCLTYTPTIKISAYLNDNGTTLLPNMVIFQRSIKIMPNGFKKNSAQNGISTGDLGMEIPFKTGHSTT